MNIIRLSKLYIDMKEADCKGSVIFKELMLHLMIMTLPMAVLLLATGSLSLILLTVGVILYYVLFIDWILDEHYSSAVSGCKKDEDEEKGEK